MLRVLIVGNRGRVFSSLVPNAPLDVEVLTAGRVGADYYLDIEGLQAELPPSGVDAVIHLAWDSRRALHQGQLLSYSLTKVVATWHQSSFTRESPCFIFLSSCAAHKRSRSAYGHFKYLSESFLETLPGCYTVRPGLVVGEDLEGRVQPSQRLDRVAFPVTYSQTLAKRIWDLLLRGNFSQNIKSESVVQGHFGPVGFLRALSRLDGARVNYLMPSQAGRNLDRLLVLADTLTRDSEPS